MRMISCFRSSIWLFSGFSLPLSAQSWSHDETASLSVNNVSIRSQEETFQSSVQSLGLRGNLKRQDASSILSANAGAAWGQAKSGFSNLRLGGNLTLLGKQSSTNFLIQWLGTKGNDPRLQPVEQAFIDDRGTFNSALFGIFHQQNISARDSLSVYASQSKNVDDGFPVTSRELQFGWDHRATFAFTHRLRLRTASQDIDDTLTISQNEASYGQNYLWTEQLSSEWFFGYSQQKDEVDGTQGPIWSVEMNYRTTAPFFAANPYEEGSAMRDISPEEIANLKGSSLYRAGWARSREARRQGDPLLYTDQLFAQALIRIQAQHQIDLNLSESRSPSEQTLDDAQDYRSRLASLFYRYSFNLIMGSRLPQLQAGGGLSAEDTRIGNTEFKRQIATLELNATF